MSTVHLHHGDCTRGGGGDGAWLDVLIRHNIQNVYKHMAAILHFFSHSQN